jgi:hypothetical protein
MLSRMGLQRSTKEQHLSADSHRPFTLARTAATARPYPHPYARGNMHPPPRSVGLCQLVDEPGLRVSVKPRPSLCSMRSARSGAWDLWTRIRCHRSLPARRSSECACRSRTASVGKSRTSKFQPGQVVDVVHTPDGHMTAYPVRLHDVSVCWAEHDLVLHAFLTALKWDLLAASQAPMPARETET